MRKTNKIWSLSTGQINHKIKAPENALPVEVATRIIEDYFRKKKKKTQNVTVSALAFLIIKKEEKEYEYVFPTDVLFANAGLLTLSEQLLNFRRKMQEDLFKKSNNSKKRDK